MDLSGIYKELFNSEIVESSASKTYHDNSDELPNSGNVTSRFLRKHLIK